MAKTRSIVKPPSVHADPKEVWDHQQDEPYNWYIKFHHFLMEGPTRSVANAKKTYEEAYEEESGHVVSWYKARAKYDWWRRAYAYDRAQQGKEEEAILQHRITERLRRYEVLTKLADLIDIGLGQIEDRVHDDDDPLQFSMAQMNRAIATYLAHSRDEFEPTKPAVVVDQRKQAFTMIEVQKEYDGGEIIDGTVGLIDG